MEQVQKKMNGDSRRRKSVMKVNTQSNSLSYSSENKIDKRKQLQDQKKNKSPTRSSKFLSMRKMRNFRLKSLDLDKSLAKGEPAVGSSTNKLRFFDVEVREYEVTVSDNPGVKSGVAIEVSIYRFTDVRYYYTIVLSRLNMHFLQMLFIIYHIAGLEL